jgi:hypothetical protein
VQASRSALLRPSITVFGSIDFHLFRPKATFTSAA